MDGSNVRAHKAAAGEGKNRPAHEPRDHALGRSRSGWPTKLHLVTDGAGLPLAIQLSAGPAGGALYAVPVLDVVCIHRPQGRRHLSKSLQIAPIAIAASVTDCEDIICVPSFPSDWTTSSSGAVEEDYQSSMLGNTGVAV
jgi:hypothetical protein